MRERGGDESDWRRRMRRRMENGLLEGDRAGDWADTAYYCGGISLL